MKYLDRLYIEIAYISRSLTYHLYRPVADYIESLHRPWDIEIADSVESLHRPWDIEIADSVSRSLIR